jgi:hypothetical protein
MVMQNMVIHNIGEHGGLNVLQYTFGKTIKGIFLKAEGLFIITFTDDTRLELGIKDIYSIKLVGASDGNN